MFFLKFWVLTWEGSPGPAWLFSCQEPCRKGTVAAGVAKRSPAASVGRDAGGAGLVESPCCFNPRAPRGARRGRSAAASRGQSVSIHAPRVGRDRATAKREGRTIRFNPRAPRGARRLQLSTGRVQ